MWNVHKHFGARISALRTLCRSFGIVTAVQRWEQLQAKLMNKSKQRLTLFTKEVAEQSDDMNRLLSAMEEAGVLRREVHVKTSNRNGLFGWEEFCSRNRIDGDRFKELLEPLMDLETAAFIDKQPVLLRAFGDDNYVLKTEFLISGPHHQEQALKLWVVCATFLAQRPYVLVPSCMRVDTATGHDSVAADA